ncbi:hypothetical protein CDAR_172891 [Caerostris darwini]|uniref:Uncharacterized protein n=1 Tax=Caerostris darwini TaxID=1538125 RepID=A0AAV4P8C5_9ARAC|nr:hypothetical protein CDAR_172891 [Caerostris darwini]
MEEISRRHVCGNTFWDQFVPDTLLEFLLSLVATKILIFFPLFSGNDCDRNSGCHRAYEAVPSCCEPILVISVSTPVQFASGIEMVMSRKYPIFLQTIARPIRQSKGLK